MAAHDLAAVLGPGPGPGVEPAEGAPCAGLRVTQQAHNRTTAVHDLIEAELFQTQMKVAAEMRSVDTIGKMATAQGLHTLSADAASWMELNRQSLRFTGQSRAAKQTWRVGGGGRGGLFGFVDVSARTMHTRGACHGAYVQMSKRNRSDRRSCVIARVSTGYDGAAGAGVGGSCVLEFELETPSMLLLQLSKA